MHVIKLIEELQQKGTSKWEDERKQEREMEGKRVWVGEGQTECQLDAAEPLDRKFLIDFRAWNFSAKCCQQKWVERQWEGQATFCGNSFAYAESRNCPHPAPFSRLPPLIRPNFVACSLRCFISGFGVWHVACGNSVRGRVPAMRWLDFSHFSKQLSNSD